MLSVNDLKNLFVFYEKSEPLFVTTDCYTCGRKTTIEIHKTSDGFGLLGGVLDKSVNQQYIAKCAECYKVEPFIDPISRDQSKQVVTIARS